MRLTLTSVPGEGDKDGGLAATQRWSLMWAMVDATLFLPPQTAKSFLGKTSASFVISQKQKPWLVSENREWVQWFEFEFAPIPSTVGDVTAHPATTASLS